MELTIGAVEDASDIVTGGAVVAIELVQPTQVNLWGENKRRIMVIC